MKENNLLEFLQREKVNFVLVGALCFFIEYFTLQLMYHVFHLPIAFSNVIAFYVATLVSYVLNKKYTFKCEYGGAKILFGYFTLSIAGAFLNTLIFLISFKILPIFLICKMISTFLVLIFNYITRKVLFADGRCAYV